MNDYYARTLVPSSSVPSVTFSKGLVEEGQNNQVFDDTYRAEGGCFTIYEGGHKQITWLGSPISNVSDNSNGTEGFLW